ncbi:MAG: hypothetical protein K0R67_1504 [Paenibacillus sp.]|nr:hypothetical protein [Paenibacillus sp.]
MAETLSALTEQLLNHFSEEKLALLSTIDAETGVPSQNAISWVQAVSSGKIRFALDQRSRIVTNVKSNPLATITVFAGGSVHAISGRVSVVVDALEGVPFKLACMDLNIDAVRDVMFYGSRISAQPEYEKTYDKRAADKLDGQVFDAMSKA